MCGELLFQLWRQPILSGYLISIEALPGVFGTHGEGLFINFQGFGEKGHLFSGIWGASITFWGLRGAGG